MLAEPALDLMRKVHCDPQRMIGKETAKCH